MHRVLLRVLTAVQLTRLTMAFGAVADIWLVILLTRATPGTEAGLAVPAALLPLPVALLCGAIVAVGLFGFGAALNDLLDVRHDTAFSPDRPIPAGRIRPVHAVVLTISALLAAMVGSAVLGQGALFLATLVAAGILFYNAAGKHIPAIGLVTVAAIHALHMAIPDQGLSFTLPLWLIAAHTIAVAAAVHRLEDKRPALSRRSAVGVAVGFGVLSAIILGVGVIRTGSWLPLPSSVRPIELAWPAVAVAAFAIVARQKTVGVPGRVAAEKLLRYGAMWQSLYAVAWLMAFGLHRAALGVGLLAAGGFTAMTIIRELGGLGARPVAYRA